MCHVVSQRIQKICLFSNLGVPVARLSRQTRSERIDTHKMMSEISVMQTLANPARTYSESLVFQCVSNTAHVSAAWAARGRTPLHLAAAWGRVEVVKLLMKVTSLAVQDKEGRGPQLRSSCGSVGET